MKFNWLAVLGMLCAGACTALPTPHDVTGLSSSQITQFVRCEMSNAVRNKLIKLLSETRKIDNKPYITSYDEEPIEKEIEKLKLHPSEFEKIDWEKFDKFAARGLRRFASIVVGYDFTLQGTHESVVGANLNLVGKFRTNTTSLNNLLSVDVTRDNKDHFRVYDSFDVLIRYIGEDDCRGTPEIPDPVYPIAGLIGFDDLVEHFFYGAENQNLGSLGKNGGDFTPSETMSKAEETRTIVFTTKMIAKIDPTVTWAPVRPVFAFAPLTFNFDNTRTDIHTVVVDIRQPAKADSPYFDAYGRLNSRAKAASSAALDKAINTNAFDSINQISRSLSRNSQF